jgi:hypothetical protein
MDQGNKGGQVNILAIVSSLTSRAGNVDLTPFILI